MHKNTARYICNACGYGTRSWLGRCPECGQFNTMEKEPAAAHSISEHKHSSPAAPLTIVSQQNTQRLASGMQELDRVLGGGMVPGSLILLGGDPGIGKSTLLLQISACLAEQQNRVLYLSGEEAAAQIKLRAQRLNINSEHILLLNEQDIDLLPQYLEILDPQLVIIDSIQTVYTSEVSSIPGSVTQLRETTARLMKIAKSSNRIFFLIGHATKDGALAGPRVLEHMVDTVIYFEGDKNSHYRILRSVKNRFGSTNEIGLLEMSAVGLQEAADPAAVFLPVRDRSVSGSAIAVIFEGSRPFLVEIQALVTSSMPAYGRRMAFGIEQSRLSLIIAVIEKKCHLNLSQFDVYLKVSGGMFIRDPSADAAIAAAILSSYHDEALPLSTAFTGEIALSGELRSVPFFSNRQTEAQKLGFNYLIAPSTAELSSDKAKSLTQANLVILHIADISTLQNNFFGR